MISGALDPRTYLLALAQAAGEAVVSVPAPWLREALEALPAVVVDLTVPQVAALFGKAASTARGWLLAGEFPGAYKVHAREWRIPPAAISAFQQRQGTPPNGAPSDLSAWRRVGERSKHDPEPGA